MSIEIIIPAQNMAEHVGPCVELIVPQLAADDVVTVVDDASTDLTSDAAQQAGAQILRNDFSKGPYLARQIAAERSNADILLFVDARCRALPGLLDSHRSLLANPLNAMSCTNVSIPEGKSLAERVAFQRQFFSLDGMVGVPGRLDFYPTANLGIRTNVFRSVGGFRSMRSGADADLCWRVQTAGYGSLGADQTVRMEWIPRSSMRDLMRQWYRYGTSTTYLEWLYAAERAPRDESGSSQPQSPRASNRQARQSPSGNYLVRGASAVISAAFLAGLMRARAQAKDFTEPQRYLH
ncbi:MAG: glycosyltransferase [Nocardiaceae bacterium]|nr:glycosyltransferase [Nocardiaceae bacterium]